MLAVQVHREIGHPGTRVSRSVVQFGSFSGPSSILLNHCALCDSGLQTEAVPPLPPVPVTDRSWGAVRPGNIPPAFLTVASAGHIWRSRAPPGLLLHMA